MVLFQCSQQSVVIQFRVKSHLFSFFIIKHYWSFKNKPSNASFFIFICVICLLSRLKLSTEILQDKPRMCKPCKNIFYFMTWPIDNSKKLLQMFFCCFFIHDSPNKFNLEMQITVWVCYDRQVTGELNLNGFQHGK